MDKSTLVKAHDGDFRYTNFVRIIPYIETNLRIRY
jgi:hypothetical protein